jgi:hypothetical protein
MKHLLQLLHILYVFAFSYTKVFSNPPGAPLPFPGYGLFKELPNTENAYYRYDSASHNVTSVPLMLNPQLFKAFDFDPVRFTLSSDKPSVKTGETFEITITAEYLNVNPNLVFTFEGANKYNLKLLLPNGFIVTGGNYYDYLSGQVDRNNPRNTYTLKGYFEFEDGSCFKLLRGHTANTSGLYQLKDTFCQNVENERDNYRRDNTANYRIEDIENYPAGYNAYSSLSSTMYNICTTCDMAVYLRKDSSRSVADLMNNEPGVINGNWGCIPEIGEVIWYYFESKVDGNIEIEISRYSGLVDYITFGPFDNLANAKNKVNYANALDNNTCENGHCNDNRCYFSLNNPFQSRTVTFRNVKAGEIYTIAISSKTKISSYEMRALNRTDICSDTYFEITPTNPQTGSNLGTSGCSGGTVTWTKDNTPITNLTHVSSGTYTATCTISYCNRSSKSVTITGNPPPQTPDPPFVSSYSDVIVNGNTTFLTSSGCSGIVKWFRQWPDNSSSYLGEGSNHPVNQAGTYFATCSNSGLESGRSNYKTIHSSSLQIIPNISTSEVYQTQEFQLTAIGCTNGYFVRWERPPYNGHSPVDNSNPLQVVGPGVYKARCVSVHNPNDMSDWTQVSFTLKGAGAPMVFAHRSGCLYDNETTVVEARGCEGLAYHWNDGTITFDSPSYKTEGPGTYWVKCCDGGNCGPNGGVEICVKSPGEVIITSNKTEAHPKEPVVFQATDGCYNGYVLWYGPEGAIGSGRQVTFYGPGTYHALCLISDRSIGPLSSIEIRPKPLEALNITSSKGCVHETEANTLTAIGCVGTVQWEYHKDGNLISAYGRSIDVIGSGTYTAWCLSQGFTGTKTSITVVACTGNIPWVKTDKSRARPDEPVKGHIGGCNPDNAFTRITYPNQTTEVFFGDFTIMGPFKYQVQCLNNAGAPYGDPKQGEVILAPIDNITVVANKGKAYPQETVVLSAYGCEFGRIEWQIGSVHITDPNASIDQWTVTGAGYYKARCIGDDARSEEWVQVYVEPSEEIGVMIDGPLRICPGQVATYRGVGCPSNYSMQWKTTENGFGNWDDSVQIRVPQPLMGRCIKNDASHLGNWSIIKVDAIFPVEFKARSNSPVPLGEPLTLTATNIPETGVSYAWQPPAGVTLPEGTNLNQRNVTVSNATGEYNGIYTLRTSYEGCVLEQETEVTVDACDNLYIKVYDELTGEEGTRLTRDGKNPDGSIRFNTLVLSVETYDGYQVPNASYNWSYQDDFTPSEIPTHTIRVNQPGHFEVAVSISGRTSCTLETDISGEGPCNDLPDTYVCSTVPTIISGNGEESEPLSNLAPGDVFLAADYKITVTEITGGNPTSGWTGKGYVSFNLINTDANAPPIALELEVELKQVQINDCYELTGGEVVTVYDPLFSNEINLDNVFSAAEGIKDAHQELIVLLNDFDGSPEQQAAINNKLNEIDDIVSQITSNDFLTNNDKSEIINQVNAIKDKAICFTNQTSSSARIGALNDSECSISEIEAGAEQLSRKLTTSTALPEGKNMSPSVDCYSSSLPSFHSITGITPDYGIHKLNECIGFNDDFLQYAKGIPGRTCGSPAGYSVKYLGEWATNSADFEYFQIAKADGTEIYYLTRHLEGSCRQYNLAKKSVWDSCGNDMQACPNLWQRVSLEYGNTTGGEAVDKIAEGFVYTLAGLLSTPYLIQFGIEKGIAEALTVNKTDLILVFGETALQCYDCNADQFIANFAENLILNAAFKGALATVPANELALYANKLATGLVNNFSFFKKTAANISELGKKASNLWSSFESKIRTIAAKGVTNTVTRSESVLGHIFRNAPGHVNPSTVASQNRYIKLFESVANNPANLNQSILAPNAIKNGVQGFTQTFQNGQIWVHTRNGKIFDAGVNLIPR